MRVLFHDYQLSSGEIGPEWQLIGESPLNQFYSNLHNSTRILQICHKQLLSCLSRDPSFSCLEEAMCALSVSLLEYLGINFGCLTQEDRMDKSNNSATRMTITAHADFCILVKTIGLLGYKCLFNPFLLLLFCA